MSTISIVHFSGNGATALLADAVAEGARSIDGVRVNGLRIEGSQIEKGRWQNVETLEALNGSDTIVFGSPTYMGGPATQFKAFADATIGLWSERAWQGKFAAGFTTGANPSGDKLMTLTYMSILAGLHGMVWVNWNEMPLQPDGTNHLGSYSGLMGRNPAPLSSAPSLSDADATSAGKFGAHIGKSTMRLIGRR